MILYLWLVGAAVAVLFLSLILGFTSEVVMALLIALILGSFCSLVMFFVVAMAIIAFRPRLFYQNNKPTVWNWWK